MDITKLPGADEIFNSHKDLKRVKRLIGKKYTLPDGSVTVKVELNSPADIFKVIRGP